MNPSDPKEQPAEHSFRKSLKKQLTLLTEEKNQFLDEHFAHRETERMEMSHFLSKYTSFVSNALSQRKKDAVENVVFIGSCVKVKYVDDQFTDDLTIVFPEEADPDRNRISFLSPVGRQLLMAGPGELNIKTPSGEIQVRLEKISNHNV